MKSNVVKVAFKGILNYIRKNIKYGGLIKRDKELNKIEPELVECRYKVNGEWLPARIDFSTGIITDMSGKILRRGHILC